MSPKSKKHRSEAQHQHDLLLNKSRHDPVAYSAASLEGMAKRVEQQRERAHAARMDVDDSKRALVSAEDQVHRLLSINKNQELRNSLGHSTFKAVERQGVNNQRAITVSQQKGSGATRICEGTSGVNRRTSPVYRTTFELGQDDFFTPSGYQLAQEEM